MSSQLYVYADSEYKYAALPISICIGVFHTRVESLTEDYINNLVEEGNLQFLHSFISAEGVNRNSYKEEVTRKLELLIPKAIVNFDLSGVQVKTSCRELPKSLHYPIAIIPASSETELLETLANYKRNYRVNTLAASYPEYGWLESRGELTQEHTDYIVARGPSNQHYLHVLELLPYLWLQGQLDLDPKVLLSSSPFKPLPKWYTASFGQSIVSNLNKEYEQVYESCVTANYPERFKLWLNKS
jgi:hypothetical protein